MENKEEAMRKGPTLLRVISSEVGQRKILYKK